MSRFDPQQLATCTYCPRLCRHVCPPAIGEHRETLIPTMKMNLLQLWQQGRIPFDQNLAEIFYACTDCGACTAFCKLKMTPQELLYDGRKDVLERGLMPESLQPLLANYEAHANPYGDAIEAPDLQASSADAPVVLLTGCHTCHHQPSQTQTLLLALQRVTQQHVGTLSYSTCCGSLLHATGAHDAHMQHARQFAQSVQHADLLIVADPACAHHLQQRYAKLGLPLKPRVSHLLQEYAHAPSFQRPSRSATTPAFYYDTSPLGRHGGIYDLPRQLIAALGYELIEFTQNRFDAYGSGSGGVYPWTSPEGAKQAAQWLLREIHEYTQSHNLSQPPPIITVGETERHHLAQSEPSLEILDLNLLLAHSVLER